MFGWLAGAALVMLWLGFIAAAIVGGIAAIRFGLSDDGWFIPIGGFLTLTGLAGLLLTLGLVTGQISFGSHLSVGSCYRVGEHWAGKTYASDYTEVVCGTPIGTPYP